MSTGQCNSTEGAEVHNKCTLTVHLMYTLDSKCTIRVLYLVQGVHFCSLWEQFSCIMVAVHRMSSGCHPDNVIAKLVFCGCHPDTWLLKQIKIRFDSLLPSTKGVFFSSKQFQDLLSTMCYKFHNKYL